MKAVIIAAGQGTRMRPLTETRPKPMCPIAGRPLLEHVMDACRGAVDGYVLVVGYEAAAIRDHFGTTFAGQPVEYVEQREQLGTAHAVGRAADAVDDRFLVLNGDCLIESALVNELAAVEGTAMAVRAVSNPRSYGVVALDGTGVTRIVEKPDDPPTNLANLGVYAFDPTAFEYVERTDLSARGEYEITETIGRMIDDGHRVTAVETNSDWLDVGRPWELLDAQERLLADLERDVDPDATVESGATLQGPVAVAAGARIRDGAYVEGPVTIRPGADVGPNAYVRGATAIGRNVRVGNAVEVKNSILLADTAAGHHAYVGDSILGAGVNLGAGTKVANLRHDDETIRTPVNGELTDTGRRKFGVVLGDGVKTGINTSLNAGVKLWPGETTGPGETVLFDRTPEETTSEGNE